MKSLKKSLALLTLAGTASLLLLSGLALGSNFMKSAAVKRGFVAKDVVADILPPPMYLIELRLVLGMALDGSLKPSEALQESTRLTREYQERFEHWRTHPPYGLEQQLLGSQHATAQAFMASVQATLKSAQAKGSAQVQDELKVAHELYLQHRKAVDLTVEQANRFAGGASQAYTQIDGNITVLLIAISALSTALFLGMGIATLRGVMRSTGGEPREVARIANAIAQGDLAVAVDVRRSDDASVMAAMERMRQELHNLVDSVRASSQAIVTGSQQVASGSLDLSQRTEEQAASLQQTATVLNEFGERLQTNAQASGKADELARTAQEVARQGAAIMDQAVASMTNISSGSRRVGEITAVIDGIAFQTNILALNAAVEAARAGEQGRGFAVVASEVRNLAQRSATAAREISALISNSMSEVDRGTQLVGQAGLTMTQILSQVETVGGLVRELSQSTIAQAGDISKVSSAVSGLDRATQQNAALVEESSAAAASLHSSAGQLDGLVARFTLTPA